MKDVESFSDVFNEDWVIESEPHVVSGFNAHYFIISVSA
jgi:hypothetical protein